MGTSEKTISHVSEGRVRPSLLSSGAPHAEHNILDAIGHRESSEPSTPSLRRWWPWALLLCAATWFGFTQLNSEHRGSVAQVGQASVTPTVPRATTTSTLAPPVAHEGRESASSPTGSRTSADPFQSLAAASEAAPLAPGVDRSLDQQASPGEAAGSPNTPGSVPSAGKVATEKKVPRAPVDTPTPGTKERADRSPQTPPTQVARQTASARSVSAASTDPAPKAPPATASSARPSAQTGRDPDVELISAIMQHLNTGKNPNPIPPARSGQTIAELVNTCASKDAIEALLCKRRICEGSWGKASACPASQAPKNAKTASPT